MEINELHRWMDEKFAFQSLQLVDIKDNLKQLNGQVRSHDRWLWLIRGVGVVIVLILGLIGIKVKLV